MLTAPRHRLLPAQSSPIGQAGTLREQDKLAANVPGLQSLVRGLGFVEQETCLKEWPKGAGINKRRDGLELARVRLGLELHDAAAVRRALVCGARNGHQPA